MATKKNKAPVAKGGVVSHSPSLGAAAYWTPARMAGAKGKALIGPGVGPVTRRPVKPGRATSQGLRSG